MSTRIKATLVIAALALSATAALAQSFPNRAVRIIVPYPAGGSVDNISRAVTPRLSAIWGQPVVIENRAGGATSIAADLVAKSPPDGYTLFATGMETFSINPYMLSKLSYDVKDFTPVSGYGLSNQILVVPSASPFKSLAKLMAFARAKPSELQYATIGLGGSSHINMVLFESMTGLKLTPVHYKGGAPAVTDLLGGHVPSAFLSSQLVTQGPVGASAAARGRQQGTAEELSGRADRRRERRAGLRGGELVRRLGAGRHAARRRAQDQRRSAEGVRRCGFPREISRPRALGG